MYFLAPTSFEISSFSYTILYTSGGQLVAHAIDACGSRLIYKNKNLLIMNYKNNMYIIIIGQFLLALDIIVFIGATREHIYVGHPCYIQTNRLNKAYTIYSVKGT